MRTEMKWKLVLSGVFSLPRESRFETDRRLDAKQPRVPRQQVEGTCMFASGCTLSA